MRNLYVNNQGRAIPGTLRAYFPALVALMLSLAVATQTFGQCTGGTCNSTISTNGNATIPAGQTYCLQKNNYSGTITFGAGSTLCIGAGITWTNASFTFTGATGTINNYGTSSKSFTLPNGYSLNNYSSYTGNLTTSSGSTFNNQSTGTYTGSIVGNAGSTITNSGTMTISGGSIAGSFSSTSGSTTTNNVTMSGTNSIDGTFANNVNGNLSGSTTVIGTLNNGGSMNGTVVINAGGTMNNNSNNVNGATNITVNGTLANNAFNLSGTITVGSGGTLSNVSGGLIQSGTVTVSSGGTLTNSGTISDNTSVSGTLTNNGTMSGTLTIAASGSVTNNGTISGPLNTIAGTLINNSGATIQNGIVESAGASITNSGTMNNGVTVNGGTFNNTSTGAINGASGLVITGGTVTNSGTTLAVNISGGTLTNNSTITSLTISGGTLTNTGTLNGSVNISGGAITNNSGATINPTSFNTSAGAGSLTNNGTLTLPSGTTTIFSGYTVTNNGTLSSGPITVNAGGTLTLGAAGTEAINGNVVNNGTINLAGSLALGAHTYSGSGTLNETSAGCNSFTVSSNTSTGSFNGGQSSYGGGLIVNSTSGGATMTNGASATVTTPTQQPTGLSTSIAALTVSGSFTSPSATITGYIVLRYIGASAPSDNPVSNTSYSAGSTIGSSTVVAMVAGGSTGVKTFTDNLPSSACGQNAYYRIFSYNGGGACNSFDLTSPLTGTQAVTIPTAVITPSGATTFCTGGSVTLTASGGSSYAWSTTAVTAAITVNTTNNYTVTVTNTTGCTASAVQSVTVNTIPTAVTVSGAGTFCNSTTLTATGGTGGTIYWENTTSNGTSTATPSASQTVSASGTYYFRANNTCGWSTQGSAAVTINNGPAVAAIAGTTTVCKGSTTLLTDATLLGTWSSSNTAIATVTAGLVTGVAAGTATISYTVTNLLNGCATTVNATVTVNDVPSATIVTGGTTQCGGTVTLSATGGTNGTIYWENTTNNGISTATPSVSQTVAASGTYYFRANNTCGWGTQGSQVVTINAYPVVAAITGTTSVCAGSTTTLSDATASGVWSSSNTAVATISAGGVVTGVSAGTSTISYTVTSAAGCVTTVTTTVTVNAVPVVAAITGTNTVCVGLTTTYSDGTPSGVWSSSNTSVATVNASGVVTGIAGGTATISYAVTNGSACVTTVTSGVTVNAAPTPSANNAVSCSGSTVTLTATGGTSYLWSTGATTASITTATAGSYTVTATDVNGCKASAKDTVTAVTNPTPSVTNPAVCAPASATITASGAGVGGSYLWSTGATTASVTTSVAGVYNVTVTNASGCSATGSGIVTINPLPTPVVPNDTVCAGTIATLTATGGVAYVWSTGSHASSITTTVAGTYTVTATSMGGCTASTTGLVVLSANPTVTTTGGVICAGVPVTLTASGASSYAWSNGLLTQSITVSAANTYTVTGSNSYGCTASASTTVASSSYPTPVGHRDSVCVGSSVTITANNGATYLWSTGATTASITISPASTTTYTFTATNAAGCSASAIDTVTVNALPVASATNGVICTGGTTTPATLTASGGVSYHWSNGALTPSITTSSLLPPTYTVTVTNVSGCTASATASVSTAAKPVITVNSPSVCSGTSTVLTATTVGGATYVWSTAATTASITVAPISSTTYTVTATNASGCTASTSSLVTDYPKPTLTASSNSPVLLNATISLTSTVTGGTATYGYTWSGPASFTSALANPTIASAQPTNGGVYAVTVSDAHACTATATTTVILNFTSPGGIPSNDALWLNANAGVTAPSGNVSNWNDQSGLNNNAVSSGTAPTLVSNAINSYPAINFVGTGGIKGSFGTAITSSATSSFIVANALGSNGAGNGLFSLANTTGTTSDNNSNSTAIMFMTNTNAVTSYRNNSARGNYTNANALGNYHLLTSVFSSTANNDLFYNEGVSATNVAFTSAALNSNMYTVGARIAAAAPSLYLKGQIAEVILFNTQLSAVQKNQVESYLAIKYGFTLDQTTATNYVGSNGVAFWNAAANGSYKNNIFGVGIDNISTLNQTQSVSINTNKLSISNATGLTYYSFLMVADNAGANTLSAQAGLPNNINAAISTVWRASQTGSRATANFTFNSSTTSYGYYAPIDTFMTVYMLIDSNADGVYETYLAPTATSGYSNTFSANLKDGALFTFGFKASIDYGDAPTVPTLIANNGAGHMIVSGVYLGNLIDGELDGQPSVNSLGDDTIGVADEDGVNFNIGVPTTSNIVTMGTNTIVVKASVAGYLNAWADFNQDGTYGGGSEYAIQNVHLVAGNNTITFNVSDSVEYGPTSMRFRFALNSGDVTGPTGLAKSGEVEDYKIYVTAPLVGACTNGFQNPGFEMGPNPAPNNYIITSETNLPYWRTTAPDKQIESWYNGFLGVHSHGGTYFMELEANLYGALYQDVYTTPGTKLTWSFAHRGRLGKDTAQLRIGAPGATAFQSTAVDDTVWGVYNGTYIVPAGQYITRLEFWAVGSYGGNTSIGNFLDDVSVVSSFDYGDAPNSYGTLLASNGPYHAISTNLYLGTGVTCDVDGQPSATASLDGLDDGITFPAPCTNCNTYTVNISAYNNSGQPATIAGWIDFNKNGVFDASERKSVTIPSSASQQTVSLTFTVTTFSSATTGTFGRFRIANDSTEIATPYGYSNSGEVEDYQIPCVALPIPVPTATTPACARGVLNLTASGSAPFYTWTGPNGYTSNVQNPSRNPVPSADSGYYRVYAIYANGCERDSAVKVTIANCTVNINGSIFDDANGNGILDGTDAASSQGKTIYAVLADNSNTVLATALIAANGSFTFTAAPAYMSGMTIIPSTTNPAIGSTSGGPLWPSRWIGTKEQYGANNQAGSGSYSIPNLVPVNTAVNNITGLMLGYDQLPASVVQHYTIPYPDINTQKSLVPANGLGILSGSDPEDGGFTSGSTFTITSLAGMNGNTLYYDANGDGTLQSYEQITGYTTITNFDPTKLIIHFVGVGSISATFTYGSTDAASKVDPTPANYVINWIGTLPVKMLYFNAQKEGETESLLKWATATEIDNDHFDIERSADGQNWEKIGEQKGAGSTSEQQNYTFTDAQPMSGVNYYRLKQVDIDGKFSYTDIAEVTFGTISDATHSESTLSVYPNPMNQSSKLNINLTSATENISEVTITNSVGQVVYSTNLPQIQNYQVFGLNLPSGVYIVSVRTQQDTQHSTRLVITK